MLKVTERIDYLNKLFSIKYPASYHVFVLYVHGLHRHAGEQKIILEKHVTYQNLLPDIQQR